MPLDLTDAELGHGSDRLSRAAGQDGEQARKLENPTTRGPIESAARRYRALTRRLTGPKSASAL